MNYPILTKFIRGVALGLFLIFTVSILNKNCLVSLAPFKSGHVSFQYTGTLNTLGLLELQYLIYKNIDKVSNKTISIIINSPGGELQATLRFIQVLNMYKSKGYKVSILVDQRCMSACFTLLQTGDYRGIIRGSTIMIHQSYISFPYFGIMFKSDYTEAMDLFLTEIDCQKISIQNCVPVLLDLKEKETFIKDPDKLLELDFVDFII